MPLCAKCRKPVDALESERDPFLSKTKLTAVCHGARDTFFVTDKELIEMTRGSFRLGTAFDDDAVPAELGRLMQTYTPEPAVVEIVDHWHLSPEEFGTDRHTLMLDNDPDVREVNGHRITEQRGVTIIGCPNVNTNEYRAVSTLGHACCPQCGALLE